MGNSRTVVEVRLLHACNRDPDSPDRQRTEQIEHAFDHSSITLHTGLVFPDDNHVLA